MDWPPQAHSIRTSLPVRIKFASAQNLGAIWLWPSFPKRTLLNEGDVANGSPSARLWPGRRAPQLRSAVRTTTLVITAQRSLSVVPPSERRSKQNKDSKECVSQPV